MTDPAARLQALEDRLTRVSEVLERTGDDVMALQLLLYAAVRSHPDRDALTRALTAERERFMAAALAKGVSENLIERVNDVTDQALEIAKSRLKPR